MGVTAYRSAFFIKAESLANGRDMASGLKSSISIENEPLPLLYNSAARVLVILTCQDTGRKPMLGEPARARLLPVFPMFSVAAIVGEAIAIRCRILERAPCGNKQAIDKPENPYRPAHYLIPFHQPLPQNAPA